MDTGPTTTLSVVTLPAVTLLVVMPAVPMVVLPPIVAESKLTFFLVATVKVLPFWVISILSPSLKVIVSPPLTSSAAVLLALTLKVAASFAVSLRACSSTERVTSLPAAAVVRYLPSPLILKDTLPSFRDLAVVEPDSPSKEMVLAICLALVAISVLF